MIERLIGRFRNSWFLFKQSWSVLRYNRKLFFFPMATGAVFTVAIVITILLHFVLLQSQLLATDILYATLIGLTWAITLLSISLFNAAMIISIYTKFTKGDSTIKESLKLARGSVFKVFMWFLITITIKALLNLLFRNKKGDSNTTASGVDTVWNLGSYLVLPILAIEKLSISETVKRAPYLFNKSWGENAIGQASLGFVCNLLGLPTLVIMLLSFLSGSWTVIAVVMAICLAYLIVLALCYEILAAIYQTSLYLYATTGTISPVFNHNTITQAFRS